MLFKRKSTPSILTATLPKALSKKEAVSPELKLSQRTVSVMAIEYRRLFHEESSFRFLGPALELQRLSDALYGMNFDKNFLNRCEMTFDWDFSTIFPALLDGTFWEAGHSDRKAQTRQRAYLLGFASALCSILANQPEYAGPAPARIHESLGRDGLRYVDGRIVSITQQVVPEQQEFSAVQQLLSTCALPESRTILSHYESGQKQFAADEFHACVGEWRSFIEALLRAIWKQTQAHRAEFSSFAAVPPMKDVFEFLARAEFFTSDEKLAFSSVWGFLSAGGHPGMPAKEDAHLSMFMALTFGHAALLKLLSWREHGFASF